MKRLIGLGIVAALLLALPLAHTAMAGGHKVLICHFAGHDGDVVIGEAAVDRCTRLEGNAISVSQQACANGHGAAPSDFGSCDG